MSCQISLLGLFLFGLLQQEGVKDFDRILVLSLISCLLYVFKMLNASPGILDDSIEKAEGPVCQLSIRVDLLNNTQKSSEKILDVGRLAQECSLAILVHANEVLDDLARAS